jgi:hypothetical protein
VWLDHFARVWLHSFRPTMPGWEVHGSTERRLVAWAFFVELKNDAVIIEAVPGKHSPHVPAVLADLKPQINPKTKPTQLRSPSAPPPVDNSGSFRDSHPARDCRPTCPPPKPPN